MIASYYDLPRYEAFLNGDTGPERGVELHCLVIRKIKGEWWFFDSGDVEPINIT